MRFLLYAINTPPHAEARSRRSQSASRSTQEGYAALPSSANRLGGRRHVGAAMHRAALERGDATLVKLRTLKRAALLGDALVAERRIGAKQLLVLLALADILFGARTARLGERGAGGDHQDGGETTRKQPRHGRAPCGWVRQVTQQNDN